MTRVAVIQGGPSSEAEVSRTSARAVAKALVARGYDTTALELDASLPHALAEGRFDVVFPIVHGALGEDGSLSGLCEILGLPYVGSGVLASALGMDKVQAKRIFRAAGLPVALERVAVRGQDTTVAARDIRAALGRSIFVKPAAQGSAIGVSPILATDGDARLAAALEEAFKYDDVALCEPYIVGREVTCGVTDAPSLGGLRALPPTEILAQLGTFYDFKSKYAPAGSAHICPADLPVEVTARLQDAAVRAHLALGCRDLSRADFIVGADNLARISDQITLLEVNTMPGMTATSLYPEAMAKIGVPFDAMCAAFVETALARGSKRRVPVLPMPGRD